MKKVFFVLMIGVIGFSGCATSPVVFTPYGDTLSPKSADAEVEIFYSPPAQKYTSLGEFKYTLSRSEMRAENINDLKNKARESGADAVLITSNKREATLLLSPGPVVIRGTFIKYK